MPSKKLSKSLRRRAQKLGLRVTVKRGGKRVHKSPKLLKKQIKRKSKRKSKRRKVVKRRRKRSKKGGKGSKGSKGSKRKGRKSKRKGRKSKRFNMFTKKASIVVCGLVQNPGLFRTGWNNYHIRFPKKKNLSPIFQIGRCRDNVCKYNSIQIKEDWNPTIDKDERGKKYITIGNIKIYPKTNENCIDCRKKYGIYCKDSPTTIEEIISWIKAKSDAIFLNRREQLKRIIPLAPTSEP